MYANPVSFPAYFPGEEDHIYYGNAELKLGLTEKTLTNT
mgnify:CR=1 FL=1